MKRLTGLLFVVAGTVASAWGGYHVFIGESSAHVPLIDDYSVSALTAGLAGVAVFTIGLIWMQD
jgi:hypothetical protein